MALKVKCYEQLDFLYAFLQTRGFQMVNNNPTILHYTGTNPKELKRMVRKDRPDLLITHSIPAFDLVDTIQVFHPLKNKSDFLRVKKVLTNRVQLAKHYYEKLGLQVEFKLVPEKKKKKLKFINPLKIVDIGKINQFFKKLGHYLYWN